MDYIYLILTITGSILAVGVSIGSVLYGLGQFRLGKKEVKTSDLTDANSTIELFKSRYDAVDDELKKLRGEFETFRKEAFVKEEAYKKTISQQEDLIKTYAAILQNRNPELENVLNKIVEYLEKLSKSSDHNKQILDNQVIREKKLMRIK